LKKLFVTLFLCLSSLINAQNQELEKPKEGKALVYFVRSNSAGFALNFRIYDKDKFLYALPYGEYLVYECDPGQHMFWAASENRDFVDAELEANRVYVVDIQGQMGMLVAGVSLVPFNPTERSNRKDLFKIVKKEKMTIYNSSLSIAEHKTENIIQGLEKYNKLKESKSSKIEILTKDMFFENANKPE
jgi:hypothetical protein